MARFPRKIKKTKNIKGKRSLGNRPKGRQDGGGNKGPQEGARERAGPEGLERRGIAKRFQPRGPSGLCAPALGGDGVRAAGRPSGSLSLGAEGRGDIEQVRVQVPVVIAFGSERDPGTWLKTRTEAGRSREECSAGRGQNKGNPLESLPIPPSPGILCSGFLRPCRRRGPGARQLPLTSSHPRN